MVACVKSLTYFYLLDELEGHSESKRYANFFSVVFASWQHHIRRSFALSGNDNL